MLGCALLRSSYISALPTICLTSTAELRSIIKQLLWQAVRSVHLHGWRNSGSWPLR